MSRFNVYRNLGMNADKSPYLIDIQSPYLVGLDSRVVIPLTKVDRIHTENRYTKLLPNFSVNGESLFLHTTKIGSVPCTLLRRPVTSLASAQHRITFALDYLLQGY